MRSGWATATHNTPAADGAGKMRAKKSGSEWRNNAAHTCPSREEEFHTCENVIDRKFQYWENFVLLTWSLVHST